MRDTQECTHCRHRTRKSPPAHGRSQRYRSRPQCCGAVIEGDVVAVQTWETFRMTSSLSKDSNSSQSAIFETFRFTNLIGFQRLDGICSRAIFPAGKPVSQIARLGASSGKSGFGHDELLFHFISRVFCSIFVPRVKKDRGR